MIGWRIMEGKAILGKYLPPALVDPISDWFKNHRALLKIASARSSKLGDYRPPFKGLPHRISVNHNLNQHEFLITLIHEMAHLLCFEKHGRRAKPHGKEWKLQFSNLYDELKAPDVLPPEVHQAMKLFFNPETTYRKGNAMLKPVLRKYDPHSVLVAVEDVSDGGIFLFNRKLFRKVRKVRTRHQCMCLNNNRMYVFSPQARVLPEQTI